MTQTASAPGNANASFRSAALALSLNVNGLSDDGAIQTATAYLLQNAMCPIGALTIPSPGASENATMFYTHGGFVVSAIRAVLVGSSSPSVTYTVKYGADRTSGTEVKTGGSTVTSTTTGTEVTTFNSAAIPANQWVWVETTAQSGTVSSINVSLFA